MNRITRVSEANWPLNGVCQLGHEYLVSSDAHSCTKPSRTHHQSVGVMRYHPWAQQPTVFAPSVSSKTTGTRNPAKSQHILLYTTQGPFDTRQQPLISIGSTRTVPLGFHPCGWPGLSRNCPRHCGSPVQSNRSARVSRRLAWLVGGLEWEQKGGTADWNESALPTLQGKDLLRAYLAIEVCNVA